VERAWSPGGLKATKTYEDRSVDLTPDLARLLQRHVAWLKAERLRRGWGEPAWLFPNEEGKPLDESRVRKAFQTRARPRQAPRFRVYDLRHTYASLLLAAGAPITYVSEQLGHANPSTTLRYYAKWIPSKGRRWVDLLDRVTRFGTTLGTTIKHLAESGVPGILETPDSFGGPSGTRTPDPLIKSQLLCQLS